MKVRAAAVLMSVLLACAPAWAQVTYSSWAEVESALVETAIEREWIPMRDGIRLDANIFLPRAGQAPYPTVLIRSPYPDHVILDTHAGQGFIPLLLENGYAFVFSNERGRYWSEGEYNYLARAKEDGYDTIDWLAKQPWSNGKIGTFGCSSSAENQLGLSVSAHPAHAAAIAQAPGAGIGRVGPYAEQGNLYRGGALQLLFAAWFHDYIYYGGETAHHRPTFPKDLTREERVRVSSYFELQPNYGWGTVREGLDYDEYFAHLPVGDLNKAVDGPVTNWASYIRRMPGDPAWEETHFANEGDTFGTPMLWMFSWYDVGVAPNIALYDHARQNTSTDRAKGNQFMVIGPMPHCQFGSETENTVVGERQLGDARYDYQSLYLRWFDYWLKGKGNEVLDRPPVEYYQMGANEWVSGDGFPPAGTEYLDFYLGSTKGANSLYGDGTLGLRAPESSGSDEFLYDPLRPVPTYGGGACCMGTVEATGSLDQSDLEIRNDVLVYTSSELEEDLTVAGFVEVELWVSSSARDTDFTVKIIDVDAAGHAFNLDDNIFRARYREGYDRKVLMDEGKVYAIRFAPLVTANTFLKGHRIRVEISSSNFPRYSRNLNTGGNNYDEDEGVVARNTIHHSPDRPSRIRIPVSTAKPTP